MTAYFAFLSWDNFKAEFYFITAPLAVVNLFRSCLFINTFGIVNVLASQVIFAFTLLTFTQFKAVNSTLVFGNGSSHNQQWRHLNFQTFTSAHTTAVVSVLKGNAVVGTQLLLFYIFLVPANTYLLVNIIFGKHFTFLTSLVFASIVLLVYVAIFLFHQLASTFTGKIHRCSRLLLSLLAEETKVRVCKKKGRKGKRTSYLTAVEKLRLDAYIAKFHVLKHNRYGITYGQVGGSMSSSSFVKFLLFYMESLLISYNMILKQQ